MGSDLTKVSLPPAGSRTVVEPVDLSRFAGFQASVTQLPALMAGRPARDRARTLIQSVKDWNYWVASRSEMLDGPPPDSDRFDLACIAAVVHALTARGCCSRGHVGAPQAVTAGDSSYRSRVRTLLDHARHLRSPAAAVFAAA